MYHREAIEKIEREATNRFERLMQSLVGRSARHYGDEFRLVDPVKIRLAVADFQNILNEFRRLK
jgi:hypothetical protein